MHKSTLQEKAVTELVTAMLENKPAKGFYSIGGFVISTGVECILIALCVVISSFSKRLTELEKRL